MQQITICRVLFTILDKCAGYCTTTTTTILKGYRHRAVRNLVSIKWNVPVRMEDGVATTCENSLLFRFGNQDK